MKQLFLALLMAAPLHGYDVKAVYADYLAAMAIYNAQNLNAEETAWALAFTSLSTLSDPKDKAGFIQSEMLPRSKRLAKAAQEVKGLFKTKEAVKGLGAGLDILMLCDTLSVQLFEAFGNSDRAALTGAMRTVAEITALEGQRAKKAEAFLGKLRKEMRRAQMPKKAIEAVK